MNSFDHLKKTYGKVDTVKYIRGKVTTWGNKILTLHNTQQDLTFLCVRRSREETSDSEHWDRSD